ncbi:response regulator [Streptomyces capparidis]
MVTVTVHVLVVDDDFMVARIHSGYVERTEGFAVAAVARTGEEAVREAARLRPDLVLLDLYLPDANGLEVLRRIREVSPQTDFLVISAARDAATVHQARRGGIVHYLVKPFEYHDLAERLAHYLEAHRGLAGTERASQDDIDRLFGGVRQAPARQELPKGLSRATADLVRRVLRGRAPEDVSAAECAAELGVSRVSARRYLEHFTDTGQAVVRLRYGSAGRPERWYTWAGR